MITPSFGLTATERVLPKLALDFTTASLDPRVTFTRTTGVIAMLCALPPQPNPNPHQTLMT